jgi:hypothetical protein
LSLSSFRGTLAAALLSRKESEALWSGWLQHSTILPPGQKGGFTSTMPAFPEYIGFAETDREAVRNR